MNIKFDEHSFKSYDTLKVLSKNGYAMGKKVHIGISTHNDAFRFNLYWRQPHRLTENIFSICCSPKFNLGIQPGESKITNKSDFADFLNTLNAVLSTHPDDLDSLYSKYLNEEGVIKYFDNE